LTDQKTNFRIIIHSHSSNNPEYQVKIRSGDFEITGLTGTVCKKIRNRSRTYCSAAGMPYHVSSHWCIANATNNYYYFPDA